MKKSILTAIVSVVIVSGTISCSSPAEKVETAQVKVEEANQDLDKAKEEYLTDMANYKIETAKRIQENEKRISEFKARVANEKKDEKAKYLAKVEELDRKNNDLKKQLEDQRAEGKDKWDDFKAGYNREMDALGESMDEFRIKVAKKIKPEK